MRLRIPSLGPELDDVWGGHLGNGFPEVDVHFPISAVVRSVIEFELEGGSVPDVAVAFRHGNRVLRPASHDPGAFLFVAVPPHEAISLKSITDENDLLIEVSAFESEIVSGSPVGAVLSPPMAVDSESLRQRENERVFHSLGEASEEMQAGMSFPGEGPVEVRESVLSPAFAALAPMVLAVSGAVTVTVGVNGFVAEVTEQMPGEGHFLFGWTPVPVGINNGLLFVVPVVGIVFGLKVLKFPEVAVDGDAWLPELDVLMDVGGVSATTLNHKSDQSVNIDLSVASLSGHPVGWVLATDQSLEDGSLGLEVLADARNVTGPGSLSTRDGVRRPDVGAILTIPMTSHVVRVLLARVDLVTTLHVAKAIVGHATPDPGAVAERRTLASGTVDLGDAIDASGGAGSANEIAVECAAHIPGVVK